MKNKKIARIGDVKLIEVAKRDYLSSIQIDDMSYEIHAQDIIEGLNFILTKLNTKCEGSVMEDTVNKKHKAFSLSTNTTTEGVYEVEAVALKSHFILRTQSIIDYVRVLEALDIRFPRRPLREFIGEAAREALRCIKPENN